MKKIIFLFAGLSFFIVKNQAQTITDYDGNVYNIITIGAQTWMKENLKVTHYRNGDLIPIVTDGALWSYLTSGACCVYNNDPGNDTTYGKLYNWYAVNDIRNISPTGWHVPSDAEWTILTNYLGGESIAGGKLKEVDTLHWCSPNFNATNIFNFTAFSGGSRKWNGAFQYLCFEGYWWSNTEINSSDANCRLILNDGELVQNFNLNKLTGNSVRCIKDATTGVDYNNHINKIQIYPNPAIDRIFIINAERRIVKMQIYSIMGECVLQNELNYGSNEINIRSLQKGIYIIILTCTDGSVQHKLTKE